MKIILLTLLAAFTFAGCDEHSRHSHGDSNHDTNKEASMSDGDKPTLNNGEKWKVNAEMIPHVEAAEKRFNDYVSKGETDYKQLASDLDAHSQSLIESCTMDGESHDNLHKWLHPHMQLIKDLSKAPSTEEAHKIIARLKASFETYHEYFI